jgi:hypothetical protein
MQDIQITEPVHTTAAEELLAIQIMFDVLRAGNERRAVAAAAFAKRQRERADRCQLLVDRLAMLEVRPAVITPAARSAP